MPEDVKLVVTVIDNAADESARAVVEANNSSARFPAQYVSEPRRGIPVARNRAIDHATTQDVDHLIFIDDDEYVAPDWLSELVAFAATKDGESVVSGDVVSIVPEEAPDHIRRLFIRSDSKRTGDKLDCCATSNVLIPLHLIRTHGLRFDESRPLAGGTDTIFFVEAVARGVTIYKCKEARVYEKVPSSRANLRWLSKRKYRVGVTEAWRKRKRGRARAGVLFSALGVMAAHLLVCAAASLVNTKHARARSWLRVSKAAGVITGIFGRRVDSYRTIEK